ncbi:hypothetical protein [Halomonas binhaiensis]|nr:hypothetical protein [Halomonas binhaiensis]
MAYFCAARRYANAPDQIGDDVISGLSDPEACGQMVLANIIEK